MTRGALHAAAVARGEADEFAPPAEPDDELEQLEAEAARLRAEIAADAEAAVTPAFVSQLHEGEHTTKHQELVPESMLHC